MIIFWPTTNHESQKYNINHVYSTAYHSQGNGSVERFNKTFLQLLRSRTQDITTWPDECAYCMNIYNNTLHQEIHTSPRDHLLKREHDVRNVALMQPTVNSTWHSGSERFEPFRVGDKVWKQVNFIGDCTKYKLQERFEGLIL